MAFADEHGNLLYYALLGICAIIFAVFSYLTYYVYALTAGTKMLVFSYVVLSPVVVSVILFILLLYAGKGTFIKEVEPYIPV